MGLPLGIGSPGRRVSIAGVVFTPTRGVIHPSFPLRGRWERTLKSGEQAPSPSLVTLLDSSLETRQRLGNNARLSPMRLTWTLNRNCLIYKSFRAVKPVTVRAESDCEVSLERISN